MTGKGEPRGEQIEMQVERTDRRTQAARSDGRSARKDIQTGTSAQSEAATLPNGTILVPHAGCRPIASDATPEEEMRRDNRRKKRHRTPSPSGKSEFEITPYRVNPAHAAGAIIGILCHDRRFVTTLSLSRKRKKVSARASNRRNDRPSGGATTRYNLQKHRSKRSPRWPDPPALCVPRRNGSCRDRRIRKSSPSARPGA
jgi:hypothetical protein